MTSQTPDRQTPWLPDADCPPQAARAADKEGLVEVPPEALFRSDKNYLPSEIAALAHLDPEMVERESVAKNISSIITVARGGSGKMYGGSRVCTWIRRRGLTCRAAPAVLAQWEANEGAKLRQAGAEKRKAAADAAERERVAEMLRQAARDSIVLATLRLLAHAEAQKMPVAMLLRAVESAGGA
jgi:hypothetical protein